MKNIKENKHAGIWRMLTGLLLLAFSFSAVSCIDDHFEDKGNASDGENTDVRLTISVPGSSLPRTKSGDTSYPEFDITDIRILVFNERSDGEYIYKYSVEGQQITQEANNPQRSSFTAKLKTSTTPIKLLFAANTGALFNTYTPAVNATEDEVRKQINVSHPGLIPATLPMYAEKLLPELDAKQVNTIPITMLRSIARVDVEVDLDTDSSKDFVLESVYVYRSNNKLQVIPNRSALADTENPKAKEPSVPAQLSWQAPYFKKLESKGPVKIQNLYLPESVHIIDPVSEHANATCVVIGGFFNGQDTPTYYRTDFNSELQGHPFGQVLRNFRYEFIVKQVNGAGWETPDEAADNRATNIVVDIKEWEDFTMEMWTAGDKYLGVDTRSLTFGYEAELQKPVGVQATVSYTISWADGDGTTSTIGDDKTISNDYFSARIVTLPSFDEDVSYIEITTLKTNNKANNPTGNSYYSELEVYWADWKFKVKITQVHATHYVKDPSKMRSLRILSASNEGTGHLGTAALKAIGYGMRTVLDNPDYFSPDGTIDYISGFSFSATPRSWFMYADPYASYAPYRQYAIQVKTEIYSADVIYLNNDNAITPYVAEVILEWLDASPNRVLIVGADGSDTSNALLQDNPNRNYLGQLTKDVNFYYNQGAGIHFQVKAIGNSGYFTLINDERDEERKDFYNGPFGEVAKNTKLRCVDGYFGYTQYYNPESVLPLAIHDNAASPSLSIGINKERRIIYFGDASIWDEGTFNYNHTGTNGKNGIISTDANRFWANLWAWITHQVVWNDSELIED